MENKQFFLLGQYVDVGCCSLNSSPLSHRSYSRRMYGLKKSCSYRNYLLLIFLFLIFIYYNSLFPTEHFHRLIEQNSNSIRIMYVIRTNSYFYPKRLIYLLQTWISLISSDVFFVTDLVLPNIPHDHTILTKETCGSDVHSMSVPML